MGNETDRSLQDDLAFSGWEIWTVECINIESCENFAGSELCHTARIWKNPFLMVAGQDSKKISLYMLSPYFNSFWPDQSLINHNRNHSAHSVP